MGADLPLAILSDRPQPLFSYFHQLFAQATNPPIDAIREEIVTSTLVYLGPEGDLLSPSPQSCRQLRLASPLTTDSQLAQLRQLDTEGLRALTLSILYDAEQGEEGMRSAMDRVCRQLDEGFEKAITSSFSATGVWMSNTLRFPPCWRSAAYRPTPCAAASARR